MSLYARDEIAVDEGEERVEVVRGRKRAGGRDGTTLVGLSLFTHCQTQPAIDTWPKILKPIELESFLCFRFLV